jgi:hypothetical protein
MKIKWVCTFALSHNTYVQLWHLTAITNLLNNWIQTPKIHAKVSLCCNCFVLHVTLWPSHNIHNSDPYNIVWWKYCVHKYRWYFMLNECSFIYFCMLNSVSDWYPWCIKSQTNRKELPLLNSTHESFIQGSDFHNIYGLNWAGLFLCPLF